MTDKQINMRIQTLVNMKHYINEAFADLQKAMTDYETYSIETVTMLKEALSV